MKKTTQAIKYALDELHLTPDKLFQLLESSQGYEGTNYEKWVAGRIIKIADSEGIPFTELLVKKLKILASLMSESDEGVSDLVADYIKPFVEDYTKVYDFTGLDLEVTTDLVDDFDWFSGTSLIDGTLGENNESNVVYIGELDSKGIGKSELSQISKAMGYSLKSKGAGMLMRFMLMDDYSQPEDNTYIFISDSSFFMENAEVVQQFMSRFDLVDAVYLTKSDTFNGSFASGNDLITVWKTYSENFESFGGDVPIIKAKNLITEFNEKLFYVDSSVLMKDVIGVAEDDENLVSVSAISLNLEDDEEVEVGSSDLKGYLSINGTQRVSDRPISGSDLVIPINKCNLLDIITYYAVSQSTEGTWGYGQGVGLLLNGIEGYESLVANCLPIFFFGYHSLFFSLDGVDSTFIQEGELAEELYDKYAPFMSFEAKVLWDLGNEYSKAMQKVNPDLKGKTFYQIREHLKDEQFESVYKQKLESAQNYVKVQSKGYLC